ncbi:hypothetical protein [Actinacidiphila glaucinigra]|uniref:hypothetical protein n=1 Tax=Actinacidiphila glaucinigra TaxID=235986 RepID=UPI002E325496|nr:hypothetical protein [Actinacidiphila glaucinigra]
MTIAAESFTGRVLAVFSRRSPAFRRPVAFSHPPAAAAPAVIRSALAPDTREAQDNPQAHPAPSNGARPTLADVTLRWKAVPAEVRLLLRGKLLALEASLHSAQSAIGAVIDRAPANSFDLTLDHGSAISFGLALDRGLVSSFAVVLDPVVDFDRGHVLELALDLDFALDRALDLARDVARGHVRYLGLAPDLGPDPETDFDAGTDFDPDLTLIRVLVRGLGEARRNLADAANDFLGADVTAADVARVDLAGICWDSNTRWPSAEWAERMYRASVEDPPGSGIFRVVPEGILEASGSVLA